MWLKTMPLIDRTSKSEIPSPMSESEIPSSSPSSRVASSVAHNRAEATITGLGTVIGFCILLIFCLKCFQEGKKNLGTTAVFFIKLAALLSCHGILLLHALDLGTDTNSLFTAMCIIPWVPTFLNLLFAMKKQLPPQTPRAPIRLRGNDTYEDFTVHWCLGSRNAA
jgi:hypothetical protein